VYSFLTKPKYSLSRYEESLAGSLADLLPMTCSYGCHPLRSRCFFACVATWLAVDVHSGLGAVLASVHDSLQSRLQFPHSGLNLCNPILYQKGRPPMSEACLRLHRPLPLRRMLLWDQAQWILR